MTDTCLMKELTEEKHFYIEGKGQQEGILLGEVVTGLIRATEMNKVNLEEFPS